MRSFDRKTSTPPQITQFNGFWEGWGYYKSSSSRARGALGNAGIHGVPFARRRGKALPFVRTRLGGET